jgi:diguanylate cyclase
MPKVTRDPDLSGVHVLVVEDDPDSLDMVVSILRWSGAMVSSANNARTGLAAARHGRPHVVVTDIALPGEDGYWLAEQLRRARPNVPVIAVSAFRPKEQAQMPFTRYFRKPIEPVDLCRAVGEATGPQA